jgi:hypothetical protein
MTRPAAALGSRIAAVGDERDWSVTFDDTH